MAKKASKKPAPAADLPRQLAIEAARLAHDANGEDIIVLDLRDMSPVTDYYVIATGTSDRQMRSVAEDMARYGKKIGSPMWHMTGENSAEWILLDFVDVVVHLFDAEHRGYYDLELLWGDAPRVHWQRDDEPAQTPQP